METKIIRGIPYVTHDCLQGSDYGGAGYLARVNVAELIELAEETGHGDHHMSTGFNDFAVERDIEGELEAGCEAPVLITQYGGYDGIGALVRANVAELVEAVQSLDDYPVLSDDRLSEYELELELEAWTSYVADDLRHAVLTLIDDEAEELYDRADAYMDDRLSDLFRDACEHLNVYPEFETSGAVYYPGMDEIERHVADYLKTELADDSAAAARRAARDGLIGDLFATGGEA